MALVTGATRGIGRAIAARFHQAGARVLINGRDVERCADLAQQLGDRAMADAPAASRSIRLVRSPLGDGVGVGLGDADTRLTIFVSSDGNLGWNTMVAPSTRPPVMMIRVYPPLPAEPRWMTVRPSRTRMSPTKDMLKPNPVVV